LISSLLALPAAILAAGLDETPEFVCARQALADGLPGVAGLKVERLLKSKGWTRMETRQLATFAAEAWTRAEDSARVLALADAYDLDDESFWRGQGLALAGDLAAARRALTETDSASRHPRTHLLLAQILAALGEHADARAELTPLLASTDESLSSHARRLQSEIEINEGKATPASVTAADTAGQFLRARALLQNGKIADAEKALRAVHGSASGGERIHHAATLLQVEILLHQKQPTAARDHLLKFLDNTAQSRLWPEAFDLLDQAHQALPEPRTLPETVLRWLSTGNVAQQQPEPPPALIRAIDEFRGHTLFLTARWLAAAKRDYEAVSLLETLIQTQPSHPRVRDAVRLAMEIHSLQQSDARVLALADLWREKFRNTSAPIDFAAGSILFRRGEYTQAMQRFQNAANLATTLTERRRALFNTAVTAILAGDFTLYQSLLGQLEILTTATTASEKSNDSAASLELEKALLFAAKRQPETESALRAFIRSHPDHPRHAEACVALTEWMLLAVPPRVEEARTTLDTAGSATTLTPSQRERIDSTRLWLHETSGDLKSLVTDGASFIKAWPKSPLLAEIRMKVASAHYRMEDFANARTEFEIIASDYPDTPHAETALYFAAMSASSVMSAEGHARALAIWNDLALKNGPLAFRARLQQALSERLLGHHDAALAALDKLLAMKALDPEQRRMTTCEKAEVLLLLGKTEPARLDAAADLLDAFLTTPGLPFFWKARAGFTLATVHHDAKRDTEALEACYNVLRAADMTPPASPADYVWFAKAGFFGIDLLEAALQWEPAARLAEQIASRPGDRASEARERATKIRLEHFLWDGPAPKPPKVMTPDEKVEPKPAEPEKPAPMARKSSR
jgi:hypothetical protein